MVVREVDDQRDGVAGGGSFRPPDRCIISFVPPLSCIMKHLSPLSTFILTTAAVLCGALSSNTPKEPRTYNYFAFGSNMCSSTMINLRNISPLASCAAMLPGHELRFNIPGLIGIEPSSASVEPVDREMGAFDKRHVVHGTLYKLTERDFEIICSTEGVPFAYSLHRCRVIPYKGDGKKAGEEYLQRFLRSDGDRVKSVDEVGAQAFTLRAARKEWRGSKDTPPSQSYLNVLIRGAIEFQMDDDYVAMLKNIKPGKTLIGNGVAEQSLKWAERRERK